MHDKIVATLHTHDLYKFPMFNPIQWEFYNVIVSGLPGKVFLAYSKGFAQCARYDFT